MQSNTDLKYVSVSWHHSQDIASKAKEMELYTVYFYETLSSLPSGQQCSFKLHSSRQRWYGHRIVKGRQYNYSLTLELAGDVSNSKVPYISRTALIFGGLMCKLEMYRQIAEEISIIWMQVSWNISKPILYGNRVGNHTSYT